MAEVELLFAKNVFGLAEVKIVAKTLIAGKDTGEWTQLAELKEISVYAAEMLEKAILAQTDWDQIIETKEFGKKTRAEASKTPSVIRWKCPMKDMEAMACTTTFGAHGRTAASTRSKPAITNRNPTITAPMKAMT